MVCRLHLFIYYSLHGIYTTARFVYEQQESKSAELYIEVIMCSFRNRAGE